MQCEVPTAFHIKGSVVFRIYIEVILCSLYTALMVYLVDRFEIEFEVPKNVIHVLGVATGMLLVFRTNTSYDRFWEGRKLWSELTTNIRSLIRQFWVMVDDKKDTKLIVEKISAINLLIAFAYATKHYLREEYSYDEDDLTAIAGNLPQFFNTMSLQETLEEEEQAMALRQIRINEQDKLTTLTKSIAKLKRKSSTPHADLKVPIGSNIPLEISYYLSSFLKNCKDRNLVDGPTCRVVDTGIANLMTILTSFERIRRTPIPIAYATHLTQVTWLILLMLPFHWVHERKWQSIPIMAITSYVIFGILGIGGEIEDPFGYDYNDLNLDDYCKIIHKEALAITAQPLPHHKSWMFSKENHPIAHNPELNAAELLTFPTEEIRKILFAGRWFKFSERAKSKTSTSNPKSLNNHVT